MLNGWLLSTIAFFALAGAGAFLIALDVRTSFLFLGLAMFAVGVDVGLDRLMHAVRGTTPPPRRRDRP